MGLYNNIIANKTITINEITTIDKYIKELMRHNPQSVNNMQIRRGFPFTPSFKEVYASCLEEQLEKSIEKIKQTILIYSKDSEQIFETEVCFPSNIGYIRYLFPITNVINLIEQANIEPIKIPTQTLYQYSSLVNITNGAVNMKKPVIAFKYPYSYPGFFVIDGNHRVHTAHKSGINEMSAYMLSEKSMPFITISSIFNTLMIMHKNLSMIGLFMCGVLDLESMKEQYTYIGGEELK